MTSFKDGRFIFIDDNQHLRVESRGEPNSFQLLYGGVTLAFAVSKAQSAVALVCPSDAATGLSPSECSNGEKCCVRLFNLDEDGLSDLVAELEVPKCNRILWVRENFLVTSFPGALTTIIELTKKLKLRVFVQDKGGFPFTVGTLLGLVSGVGTSGSPSVDIWDLQKNKRTETVRLPKRPSDRRGREGKKATGMVVSESGAARVVSTSCSGCFVVLERSDGTFDTLYGDGKEPVKLLTCVEDRPPIGQQSKANKRGKNSTLSVGGMLCVSPSPSHVVVGSTDRGAIERFAHIRKSATLHAEGVMTIAEGDVLIALTHTRCLVRKASGNPSAREGAMGAPRKAIYMVHPVALTAAVTPATNGDDCKQVNSDGKDALASAAVSSAAEVTGEGATRKQKKRKRNRKKGIADAAEQEHAEEKEPAGNGEDGLRDKREIPAVVLVAGIACVAVAFVLVQLRRSR